MIKIFILVLVLILTGCMDRDRISREFNIIDSIELEESLFIQGLEKYDEQYLLCGLGLYEDSRIGLIDISKGKFIGKNGEDENIEYFGEGLSIGPKGNIYQLTWKEETLFIRDGDTFEIIGEKEYEGQGWGLSYNDEENVFYMTDGSDRVFIRDGNTFEIIGSFKLPYSNLNELEYAEGMLYLNVWKEPYILEVSLDKKEIVGKYDFKDLVEKENKVDVDAVLNGISHVRDNIFYISGKNWDHIYMISL